MKIALIQMAAREDKEDSLSTASQFVMQAAALGADIAVLPEMFNCPYDNRYFPVYAEEEGGESWTRLSQLAAVSGIYLVAGSMPEFEGARNFNTAYVFDRKGRQIAKHRKMHLFDVDIRGGQHFMESETLTPGEEITVFDTEFGRMGLGICYDIRFVEYTRLLALKGARAVFFPAAFNMTTGPAHWELTFRARALDNQIFMIGCSQARLPDFSYVSYGHSIITDPWGRTVVQMDETEGMVLQEINLSETNAVRDQLPILRQRRTYRYELKECCGIKGEGEEKC